MYEVYFDKLLFPIAPAKIDMRIKNQNNTMKLVSGEQINILKKPGLTEIKFSVLLPNQQYPFAKYKNRFTKATYYLKKLEQLKVSGEPFQFIVIRKSDANNNLMNTNMKVSLEDYTIKEDAKNGSDITVQIKLKKYINFGTKTINISNKNIDRPKVKRETKNSPEPKTQARSHIVVRGDCLWAIAKKYYNDGSKYPVIYQANKAVIDGKNRGTGNSKYTIYPNQKLSVPIL